MTAPKKPILHYYGGKHRLAGWIIGHFPKHDIYLEPFAGGGSVFFGKAPAPRGETINDLDGEIVNLFTMLRERPDDLIRAVAFTPWSRAEQRIGYQATSEPVERARRLIVRSHFSHGAIGTRLDRMVGFRRDGTSGRTVVARYWRDLPDALARAAERLLSTSIEQKDAADLIADFDDPDVLIYADPPYVKSTRSKKHLADGTPYHGYVLDFTDADHERLLDCLTASKAMIILSGYRCPLYDDRLGDWLRIDKETTAYRSVKRIESLWLNPLAAKRLGRERLAPVQERMFADA